MAAKSDIKVKSSYGHIIHNAFIRQDGPASGLAVLFPGANYSCEAPLLHYAASVALQFGQDVLALSYGFQGYEKETGKETGWEAFEPAVTESMDAINQCGHYDRLFFVSKSVGTLVAGEITKRIKDQSSVRNLFLTPLKKTIPYINELDCAVVYGGADRNFTDTEVSQVAQDKLSALINIPFANHGLEAPGDYSMSLQNLSRVCGIYEDFFLA